MPYKILLATNSPLYAPIFHAWATGGEEFRNEYHLTYAEDSSENDDLLVEGALREYSEKDVLLAIGDLSRLHWYWLNQDHCLPPVILHGFIDRMCLWLLDGSEFAPSLPAEDSLHGGPLIMCHPRHMTTYHVAKWYASELAHWDEESINRRIRPVVRPGWEREFYYDWNEKSKGSFRIAYMSTELPINDAKSKVAVKFHEKFSPISMTGIFTSAPMAADHPRKIEEFCDRLKTSIRILYTEGDQLAWDLHKHREFLAPLGASRSYAEWHKTSEHLALIDGYSTNLALTEDQLREIVKLRAMVDGLDGDLLFSRLSSRAVLPSGFTLEVSPAPREDMLVHVFESRQKLRAEVAQRETDEIRLARPTARLRRFRVIYALAAVLVAGKEVAIWTSAWPGMAWTNVEAAGILVLFLIVFASDGIRSARAPREFSLVDISAFLLSQLIFILMALDVWAHEFFMPEGLITVGALAGAAFLRWVGKTNWRPAISWWTDWQERRERLKEAGRSYKLVLGQFSKSTGR